MSESIIVRRGGGGVGATLTVTGIDGHAITITKEGKTYTRTFDSSGKAVFKGLASGEWTLTMTGGGQTATRSIFITADYAITITYFMATITITYPAGSTCTCTDGNTTLTAPDTSGTWACVVPSTATWTVSCTDGTDTASKEVSITAEGQGVSVDLSYYVYFYKAGDECESITGGWKNQLGSLKKSADHMHLSAAAIYSQAIATTANPLDMSGIKTLCFDVQYSALYGGNTVMGLVTGFQGASSGGDIGSYSVCEAAANTADRAIYTIDVSKLSGKYYPYIRSRWGDLGDVQVDIFNVYGIPA